eukprot:3748628-Rhodomonas_salina.4
MARHGRLRHGLCHGRARRRLRRGACLLAGGLSRPHDGHQRAGRAGHDAVGPERAVLRQHARGQQLARSSVHQSRVAGPGLGAGVLVRSLAPLASLSLGHAVWMLSCSERAPLLALLCSERVRKHRVLPDSALATVGRG